MSAILLVDDDVEIVGRLAEALTDAGHTVDCSHNGADAIDQLTRATRPDLIVLDLHMPVMDGWSFRVRQKENPLWSSIPVIALSGDQGPQARAIDAAAYFAKPIETSALLEVIAGIVADSARGQMEARLRHSEVELRQTAESLREARDRLEQDVIQRTSELSAVNAELWNEIASRRQILDALWVSEQELAEAQAMASLGSWSWNLDSGVLRWSDELCRIFGYEPQGIQPTYERFVEHVYEDDRALLVAEIESTLSGASPAPVEYRIIRRDGTVRVLHDERRVLDGEPLRMAGTIQDITERRVAEDAVRRAAENFRALVDRSPDPIMVHRGGAFLFVNAALLSVLDYSGSEELIGRPVVEVMVHPDDAELVRSRIATIERTGEGVGLAEVRCLRSDGGLVILESTAMPLDFNGRRAIVDIARDVTEQKRIRGQLILAERMASVGTLAAGIAHEINNPLAFISTNLELIAEEIRGSPAGVPAGRLREISEMLEEAREGAERVRKIVRGLKTFSRADEERRVALDVRQVLEASIGLIANEVRHQARLTTRYGEVPLVEADEARLGQVFINLIANASQALPRDRFAWNEIAVATSTDGAGRAVIEVRDTGPGIPRLLLSRIFEPFFTTRPVGSGTGLGLSICHGIVTSLGGEITVESEEGKGTRFRIVLPPARPTIAGELLPIRLAEPGLSRGRVLIVDDEPAVGKALARALREHEVTVVSAAKEALPLLSKGAEFDLILCDVMMPEMSGMALYEEIARLRPELIERIVFMTGGAFDPALRLFLERVPSQCIEKPFDSQRLRALVRRHVPRMEAGASARR